MKFAIIWSKFDLVLIVINIFFRKKTTNFLIRYRNARHTHKLI